jgi:hypothetical protein
MLAPRSVTPPIVLVRWRYCGVPTTAPQNALLNAVTSLLFRAVEMTPRAFLVWSWDKLCVGVVVTFAALCAVGNPGGFTTAYPGWLRPVGKLAEGVPLAELHDMVYDLLEAIPVFPTPEVAGRFLPCVCPGHAAGSLVSSALCHALSVALGDPLTSRLCAPPPTHTHTLTRLPFPDFLCETVTREDAIRTALLWLGYTAPAVGLPLYPVRRRSHGLKPEKSQVPYRAADPRSLPACAADRYRVVIQATATTWVAVEVRAWLRPFDAHVPRVPCGVAHCALTAPCVCVCVCLLWAGGHG